MSGQLAWPGLFHHGLVNPRERLPGTVKAAQKGQDGVVRGMCIDMDNMDVDMDMDKDMDVWCGAKAISFESEAVRVRRVRAVIAN